MKGLLIGFCFVLILSCKADETKETALTEKEIWVINKGWKAENNENYFIQFPKDWILIENDLKHENGFRLESPKTSENDTLFENIILSRLQVRQDTRIDYFGARTVNNYQFEYGRDYKVHSRELIMGDNHYYRIDATLKTEEQNIRGIQYMLKRESSVFVLTLTCTPETFEQHQEIGEKIMQSFIPKEKFWIKNPKPYLY